MLEHVNAFVVLMLENRSFDHMLGFLRADDYPVAGLTGEESNPVDPSKPSSDKVRVSRNAAYHGDLDDPGHSLNPAVLRQLYGLSAEDIVKLTKYPSDTPRNNGFVYDYGAAFAGSATVTAGNIMKCFDPPALPALATLAREFAVCDHWFASVPGPTLPNRWFMHCASSGGYVGGSLLITQMMSIFQLLEMAGHSWKIYFHDMPHSLTLMRLWSFIGPKHFGLFEGNLGELRSFETDAKEGTLPQYAFVEPRYFDALGPANDEHPPHDVLRGEQLVADLYNSLRASPQWNESMLVITYDEHGGTYDHVPPPATCSPDGLVAYDDFGGKWLSFKFDRLGVRVPGVVISPYVKRGTISSVVRDHTSVLRTIEDRLGLASLTRRDEQASPLTEVLNLETPRPDTPQHIDVGSPTPVSDAQQGERPLSEFQDGLLDLARILPSRDDPAMPRAARHSESEAGAYVRTKVERLFETSTGGDG